MMIVKFFHGVCAMSYEIAEFHRELPNTSAENSIILHNIIELHSIYTHIIYDPSEIMKHLFAHRTRSSEWNYGNSGILEIWSNQVSETFCLTQYLDHDCLCNRHLAYGSNKELFSRNIILTMIVCSISTWHIFFPTSATFSRLCFKRESIFKAFSWMDEKLIALVIFKIHCLMSNRCEDKDNIWMSLWEALNKKRR